jgi:hypothetical protein
LIGDSARLSLAVTVAVSVEGAIVHSTAPRTSTQLWRGKNNAIALNDAFDEVVGEEKKREPGSKEMVDGT